jgi:hypothetical protein
MNTNHLKNKDDKLTVLRFQAGEAERGSGRVLVASGARSRNRDFWSGKAYRLVPAGMRLENWQRNPLIFYMHHFGVPLATGEMFLDGAKLWALDNFNFHRKVVPVFSLAGADGFDTGVIADLWEENFLNAMSIHIILDNDDELAIVETDDEILIPTSEVIEASVVTVPGDPLATREEQKNFTYEFMDRMIHKGVPTDMAECVACEMGGVELDIPTPARVRKLYSVSQVAEAGGLDFVSQPEDDMEQDELVEEATPAVELEAEEEEIEVEEEELETEIDTEEEAEEEAVEEASDGEVVEQELRLSVTEIAEAIAQDREALMTFAIALVNMPEFVEGISEALSGKQVAGESLEAAPARQKLVLKLVSSEQRTTDDVAREQVARPVRSVRQSAADPAKPVTLPGSNGQKQRKPSALDLVRPRA